MRHLLIILWAVFSLMLTNCNGADEESAEGADGEQAAPVKSEPMTLAQSISGVYTGKADTSYDIIAQIPGRTKVKIWINHSGNDINRSMIVRVQKSDDDSQFFCTLLSNLSTAQSDGWLSKPQKKFTGEKKSSGRINDAVEIDYVAVTEENAKLIISLGDTEDIAGDEVEKVKNLTITNEALPSFSALKNSCFTQKI